MEKDLNLISLKQQFAQHLESLKNLTPQGLAEMTSFIISLGDQISRLAAKPGKTDEEFELVQTLSREIRKFIDELAGAQIVMRKTEWKNTEAYYMKLKAEAASGDPAAMQVFKDFEPVYLEMQERMKSDDGSSISPASAFIDKLPKL